MIKQLIKKFLFRNGKNEILGFVYYGRMKDSSIDTSATGERKHLEKLVDILGLHHGFCVDIGANDGFSNSCTLGLFANQWSGLAIEMNSDKFATLAYLYSPFKNVTLLKTKITPKNVLEHFSALKIPHAFDVLNIDIDSYDLEVCSTILENYRPKIITMEINEKIPAGIYFSVKFTEEHVFRGDHFFGCSISAANEVLKAKKYLLWKVVFNNAFFVDSSVADNLIINSLPSEAWRTGYKESINRQKLFHFNSDVDYWLDLEPEEVLLEINSYFKNHAGKYDIRFSYS
jgi:hypothetical protein